ncbi:UNC-50 family-domain-containing protein [Entophlyctis helioformis]|nr:UNC-50 family-domain-containing protein [Entophlyctis helioformis]
MLPISNRPSAAHYGPLDGNASARGSSALPGSSGISPISTSSSSAPRRRIRRSSMAGGSNFGTYLRRILSVPSMDFELALWQMTYLVISPRRVYRNVYHNKQTKNHWARDDPAFHVLIAIAMCIAATAYGIAFKSSFVGIIRLIVYTVLAEFLGAGLVIATTAWFLTNQFMLQQQIHAVDQSVEWMYAFDVHCNAFVPFFLVTYVVQFFFLPVVLADGLVCRILANSIYLVAFVYYWYITFLGYNALPFLKNTIAFLYPIGVTLALFVLSLATFNASKVIFALYFE